ASASAAPAAGTILAGPRLVDGQRAAVEIGAVHRLDRLVGAVGHFHEPEPARPAGLPIGHDARRGDGSVLRERLTETIDGRLERQVADVQLLAHALSSNSNGWRSNDLETAG